MLYFFYIALGLWFLRTRYFLTSMKTHDQVLFQFCDLRRDMIRYLYENKDMISIEEYLEFRKILDSICNTIHFYNEFKVHVFNTRNMRDLAWRVESSARQIDEVREFGNEEMNGFALRYERCVLRSFFAYTPFLGTELSFKFAIAILKIVVPAIRRKSAQSLLDYLEKLRLRVERLKELSAPTRMGTLSGA